MLPRMRLRNPASKVTKVGKVLAASSPEDAYLSLVSYWDDAESMVVGAGPTVSMASRSSEWPALDGITEQMLWLDLVSYLPDDILTKLDRAAMATSLETRVPILDRAVFDLAWRLPMSVKLHEGATKWILRQVLYRHVPQGSWSGRRWGSAFPSVRCFGARCGRGPRSCSMTGASRSRGCSTQRPSDEHGPNTSKAGATSPSSSGPCWRCRRGWTDGCRASDEASALSERLVTTAPNRLDRRVLAPCQSAMVAAGMPISVPSGAMVMPGCVARDEDADSMSRRAPLILRPSMIGL